MSASSDQGAAAYPPSSRAWYAVALLALAIVTAYLDRQILLLLVEPIKAELHVSDTQIGALQGLALGLFMAVAAVPLGRVVDRSSRRRLIAISVLAWSVMTALSGLAQSYEQLFLCRAGVGLSEAGLAPAVASLLADMFPPRRRIAANLVYMAIAFIGASATIAIGGLALRWIELLQASAPGTFGILPAWRMVFLVLAAPGPLLALLFFTFDEPSRKDVGPVAVSDSRWDALRYVVEHRRVYGWLFGGLILMTVAEQSTVAWLPTILVRVYDYPVATAGVQVGMVVSVTSLLSFACGYVLARRLAPNAEVGGLLRVNLIGLLVAMPGLLLSLAATSGDALILLLSMQLFGIWLAGAVTTTLLQTMVPNQLRGQVVALFALCTVAATAIHPIVIGLLSDRVFITTAGLRWALATVAIPTLLLATPAILLARRFYR